MRIWPFGSKLETRQDGYSDTLIAALVARAQGKALAVPSATGALEACAGVVGRGFMACEISGRPVLVDALKPDVMEMIGRSLIRTGESVFLIDTTAGRMMLLPAETWDVTGGPKPASWEYRLTLGGPSRTHTYDYVPAMSVLHFRYASDPSRPWRGNGPLQVAALAGRLSAETINALGDESSGPVGSLLGIPKDGDDGTVNSLKSDITNARGRVALIESGDWGESGNTSVNLLAQRFGADPPQALVNLQELASREIMNACGLNIALFGGGNAAAVREAWRLALFGVLSPLGKLVESELKDKMEDSVTLSWQELRASDLSGRARAFQSMVGGGMDVAQAVTIAGLMTPED